MVGLALVQPAALQAAHRLLRGRCGGSGLGRRWGWSGWGLGGRRGFGGHRGVAGRLGRRLGLRRIGLPGDDLQGLGPDLTLQALGLGIGGRLQAQARQLAMAPEVVAQIGGEQKGKHYAQHVYPIHSFLAPIVARIVPANRPRPAAR